MLNNNEKIYLLLPQLLQFDTGHGQQCVEDLKDCILINQQTLANELTRMQSLVSV